MANVSPEYLQNVSEDLIKSYTDIETELLVNISKKLKKGNSLLHTIETTGNDILIVDWQLERLSDLNGLTKENAKIIAKNVGFTIDEVNDIFQTASMTLVDETTLKQGAVAGVLNQAIPIDKSLMVRNTLQTAIDSTLTTFNTMSNTMLNQSGVIYRDIINSVSAEVLAGTRTPFQAMGNAIRQWNEKGVPSFIARNGAEWSTEAYASLVIRSDVRNTVNDVEEQRFREYGSDYVELNAYSGARPKCALDQGKIYSLSGNTQTITDINGRRITPQDWGSTSFGQIDGILGVNCGHQRFAFVPTISAFDKKKIDKKESSKEYIEKQEQRYIERNIRASKREVVMMQTADINKSDIIKAKKKTASWQNEMRTFINKTGRTRRYQREQIF